MSSFFRLPAPMVNAIHLLPGITTSVDHRHRWLKPLLLCASLAAAYPAYAQQPADLTELSLESLMQLTVVGASKYEQRQNEVAAAVSVITRSEIKA